MKSMKTILLFALLLTIGKLGFAQKSDKVGPALSGFMKTEFMLKFQDIRMEAEGSVKTLRMSIGNYPPGDVARLRVAYNQTASRFNRLLENIKSDFMDQQKMKFIGKYPDSYSKELELELIQLSDFYAQNFQQALADVTGGEVDGSPLLLLLPQLVKLVDGTIGHFLKLKKEAKLYNDNYLNKHFIKPNRFKNWDELNNGNSGGEFEPNYDDFSEDYDQDFEQNEWEEDPVDSDPMNEWGDEMSGDDMMGDESEGDWDTGYEEEPTGMDNSDTTSPLNIKWFGESQSQSEHKQLTPRTNTNKLNSNTKNNRSQGLQQKGGKQR